MAVINRHRALVELACESAFVTENTAAGCVEIWHAGVLVAHLRWTTFRAMIEERTLVETPVAAGQTPRYVLSKEA